MVEPGVQPTGFAVAIRAIRAQIFLVNVVLKVTANAGAGRIAVLVAIAMAVRAGGIEMRSDKMKVRQIVIEGCFDQADNIGFAAFVIRMAGHARIRSGQLWNVPQASFFRSISCRGVRFTSGGMPYNCSPCR